MKTKHRNSRSLRDWDETVMQFSKGRASLYQVVVHYNIITAGTPTDRCRVLAPLQKRLLFSSLECFV